MSQSRLAELFQAAVEATPEARAALLGELDAADPPTAARLRALLDADDRDGEGDDFLDTGAGPAVAAALAQAVHGESRRRDTAVGTVIGGYRLLEQLGVGGGGEVYKAESETGGRVVALKLLASKVGAEARQVLRFRREFRAISRLDHPGCLKVFEEGVHDGRPYFVMEYMEGGDLRSLRGADTETLLAVLLQIAAALDYVHSQRIVHRDLKPANVLLLAGEPPVPKLADFGIAKLEGELVPDPTLTETGTVLGTLDYLSPEQLRCEPADPRSDLYALGCLIFSLFTGRPPFRGTVWQRLAARASDQPPSLLGEAPEVPPGLDALTRRLLAVDPTQRPQSALEVMNALAELLGEGARQALLASIPRSRGYGFLYRPPVAGRHALTERIVALTQSSAPPALVAVVGEAGAGKSAFSRLLVDRLQRDGRRCVMVRVDGQRGGSPFEPFPSIARQFGFEPDELTGSWSGARWSLEQAQQSIARRFFSMDDASMQRRQRAVRLVDTLVDAHAETPLALVIEDIHEMGDGGWAVLADIVDELLTRDVAMRPAVAVTLRPVGREQLKQLGPCDATALEFVALAPLDDESQQTMVTGMLGVGRSELPDGLVAAAQRESSGNPLLLQSFLRALVDCGALARVEGGWRLELARWDGLMLPDTSERLVRSRLAGLADATTRALRAACAVGPEFDLDLVAPVSGLEEDLLLDALDEALRAGVVEELEGSAYGFTHKWLAEFLYRDMPEDERCALHGAIGERLLSRPGTATVTVAHHVARGPDVPLGITWLQAAADEALEEHAPDVAERHLRQLVSHLGRVTPPDAARLAASREALADALLAQGKSAQARSELNALLGDGPASSGVHTGRLLRKLGIARLLGGDTQAGIEALEQALAVLDDAAPTSRAGVFMGIARNMVASTTRRWLRRRPAPSPIIEERMLAHRWLGALNRWIDLERAALHAMAHRRLADETGDARNRIEAYAVQASIWTFLGRTKVAAQMDQMARDLAADVGDPVGVAWVELLHGTTMLLSKEPDRSVELFSRAVDASESLGDRFLHALSLGGRGYARLFLGEWTDSDADFEAAYDMAREVDMRWLVADASAGRSLLLVATGRMAEGTAMAKGLVDDPSHGLPSITALATEVLGGAALIQERYDAAIALLEDARERYWSHRLETAWGFMVYIELSEALCWKVDCDGVDSVPDFIPRLRKNARLARRSLRAIPVFRGYDRALAGVVAAREGKRKKALALFDEALAARVGPDTSYLDTWLTMRMAIERVGLGGPRSTASEAFDQIERVFEAQDIRGMLAWVQRTRKRFGY